MRNFRNSLEADIILQEQLLMQYGKELERLPAGTLEETCAGKALYHKKPDGRERRVDKNGSFAQGVSRAQLLRRKIKILEGNIRRQKKLLEKYISYTDSAVMEMMPKVYRRVLLRAWEKEAARSSDAGAEAAWTRGKHKSLEGASMDSKSEVIISMVLEGYGVKYYRGQSLVWPEGMPEQAEKSKRELELPWMVVPDFIFVLPSGEKIYWEHLGLLGDKKYSLRWMKKLVFYHWLGITQGVNLIVTADDRYGTVDPEAIAEIIETKLAPLITKPRRR